MDGRRRNGPLSDSLDAHTGKAQVTDILFAALMLTFGGCLLWAFDWLRRYVLGNYRIVKR